MQLYFISFEVCYYKNVNEITLVGLFFASILKQI